MQNYRDREEWFDWGRLRQSLGVFRNVADLDVELVDAFGMTGATIVAGGVRLRVARDWYSSVWENGLADISGVFLLGVETREAGRRGVGVWRARWIGYENIRFHPPDGGPWRPTGESALDLSPWGCRLGFVARTPCGFGAWSHSTPAGAVEGALATGRRRRRLWNWAVSGSARSRGDPTRAASVPSA